MTSLSHGAGCACKLSLDELRSVLDGVAPVTHPDLVVGLDTGDDAAVWRLADGTHLVATTDFFTPLVDDPHDWGRIAAANAVSDVFAMGAQPRFGLNVLGWPRDLPFALLREVLAGAAEVANEAGYPLVGGHSIDSAEPLYGQAVVGEVEPAALLTNAGAKVRQAVVLTKPLGTGIVTTALKRASSAEAREPTLAAAYDAAVASMTRLNRDAALAARAIGATAATDVTGFGLLGHLHRLAAASGAAVDLQVEQVPVLPHVAELRDAGAVPGGTRRNADQAHRFISGAVDDPTLLVLADAQTSGGLLITCAPVAADDLVAQLRDTGHDAARIATIVDGEPGHDPATAMTASAPDPRAQLPSMTALLEDERVQGRIASDGRRRVVGALRSVLDAARGAATSPSAASATHEEVVGAALASLDAQEAARSRRVLNATGVVLHTNLGRAALSESAVRAMADAAGATNVEYDLAVGRRGGRGGIARTWLAELCGAAAAAVVNNGAGALVLAMAALAHGREVVVGRGELVEIGGSFRLPEILEAAGVVLREVGTTNRTHVRDYERAVGPSTGALLRVHTSNYRIEGFVSAPTDQELAAVARRAGVPLVLDLGSGLLQPSDDLALQDEPDATSALAAGADLVVFSGDKLLGGPQAGVLAGDGELVARCDRHPLARALRVDKARLAALEATLEAYLRDATFELPTWAQLVADPDELERRARDLADGLDVEVVRTTSVPGGGSLPGVTLPSWGVVVPGPAEQVASAFRGASPPVVGRIEDGSFVLDLRSIPGEDDVVLRAVITTVLDRS